MQERQTAWLALEGGYIFKGVSLGALGKTSGEIIFNTTMTGYQEVLTDPSYAEQLITFTCPHIGNVGLCEQDLESDRIWASACILRELPTTDSSHWRAQENSLESILIKHGIVGIANIDTREVTRLIRKKGCLKAAIVSGDNFKSDDTEKALDDFKGLVGVDLASKVSTQSIYQFNAKKNSSSSKLLVVYDFGVKRSILTQLEAKNCTLTVVPIKTPLDKVLNLNPDGIVLSNGPGDPTACSHGIAIAKSLIENNQSIPILGICFGHQVLSLAAGASVYKMPFGHHGGNHPVQNVITKRVLITSQNHGFAVDEASLPKSWQLTHRSLFDKSLQGIQHKTKPILGFQGHPEASPGAQDANSILETFIKLMN